MILTFTRFIPLAIVVGLLFVGVKARKNIHNYLVPTSTLTVDFALVEKTEEMGIYFKHQNPVLDLKDNNTLLVFYMAGAAVADFNSDGWMDILLLNSKSGTRSALYLNEKGQNFREATDQWGLDQLGNGAAPTSPVVLDFDNDGRPDLYVGRLGGCSLLFRNTGTQFERVPLNDCSNSAGAVPVDVNQDGLLDLYVLRYWPDINYFNLGSNYPYSDLSIDSVNGGVNHLFLNSELGFQQMINVQKDGRDSHWSIDAAVGRLSPNDDFLRVYTANDFGLDSVLVVRDGGLIPDQKARIRFGRRHGMSVSLGDLDGSGFPHIYVSNIYTPQYQIEENYLWKVINGELLYVFCEHGNS